MIKLKNKEDMVISAFLVCEIYECKEEATHLFTTETRIIDVCEKHHNKLISQSFIS